MGEEGYLSGHEEAFAAIITNTFFSQNTLSKTKHHRMNQKPGREVVVITLKHLLEHSWRALPESFFGYLGVGWARQQHAGL